MILAFKFAFNTFQAGDKELWETFMLGAGPHGRKNDTVLALQECAQSREGGRI